MPRRFLLESIYAAAEYDRRYPATLRAVGTLLDAVLDGPAPDPDIDRLLRRLEAPPPPTRH
jgi:hypothetical protein